MTLGTGTADTPQRLANLFVLTERGGVDPLRSGQVVLWTPGRGHEVFSSIHTLREEIEQRLQHPIKRLSLLENLPIALPVPHQVYRWGALQRIDDDILENRLSTYSDSVMDGVDQLLSMGLGARALQDRLDSMIEQPAPTNLARAMAVAKSMINQQALPVWLGMAPAQDQIHQAELLEQYHNNAPEEEDYLQGITPIRAHTFTALLALLDARFPGLALNPDHILIPVHQALDIHDYSLTDFALRHWPNLDAENIRPRSRSARPLPDTLNASAVIQMVRQLDLKAAYQKLLHNQLNARTDEGRQRRRLFCRQLPWQTLQFAHELALQEQLSAQALSWVQQVFDMPDAVARAAMDGATAVIRPLELIATAGAAPVKAVGMYLIGAVIAPSAPLVLYAPYSENHVLKEYADEQALLDEIDRPGELQDWLISHLEPPPTGGVSELAAKQPLSPLRDRVRRVYAKR
ncbi:dermonecrotic toxin domain-containing protein [Pseudomonas kitaguniensis]|uniref:dermonecrotic toxin domain-containing protein n=1 Tax=Pseudomonas kitaguniensis TaxID=2607908 RepID=UPI0031342A6D